MRPAASAQNMNASSASGLCASRIVRRAGASGTTFGGSTDHLGRLLVKRVEVLGVLRVLGPLARALRGLVLEELAVCPSCAGGLALEVEGAGPQHEREEVGRHGAADGVRLRQRRGRVPSGELQDADVIG